MYVKPDDPYLFPEWPENLDQPDDETKQIVIDQEEKHKAIIVNSNFVKLDKNIVVKFD